MIHARITADDQVGRDHVSRLPMADTVTDRNRRVSRGRLVLSLSHFYGLRAIMGFSRGVVGAGSISSADVRLRPR